MVQLSHPYMTTGKNKALTRRTFVGKVMSLTFSKLSKLWETEQKADQNFYLRSNGARVFSDQLPNYPKSLQMVTAAMKLKDDYSLEGKL